MKRILTSILTVSLAASLTACGNSQSASPAESTAASSVSSSIVKGTGNKTGTDKGEYLEGNYIYEEGNAQWIIRVRTEGGLIMVENSLVDGLEIYMQYVQEIWPHERFTDDGYASSVTGIDIPYDIDEGIAEYWNLSSDSTLTLTEDGISMRNESEGDASSISFVKSNEMIHTEDAALRDELAKTLEQNIESKMVGEWKYFGKNTQAWLCLKEDGTMEYLVKDKGEPAAYYSGGWTSTDGYLYILSERMGTGKESYTYSLKREVEDGSIKFSDEAKTGILPEDAESVFYQAEPAWSMREDLMFDSSVAISESVTEEGTAELAEGDIAYSYHLPYLDDGDRGSDDAAAINAEIAENFETTVEDQMQLIINKTMPDCPAVGWFAHIYDDVMGLVVYQENALNKVRYTVYCYGLANGTKVSRQQLLDKAGVTEEEMLKAAGEAAEAYFIRTNADLSEQQKKDSGYEEMLVKTKSSEYINSDMQILLDSTGELIAIVPVPSLAGDSYYYHELYLSFRTGSTEGYDPMTDAPTELEAMDILSAQKQIQGLLEQGMKMLAVGQTIEIDGELCAIIAIGTDHSEQFVSEYQYAVSKSYMIYKYDPITDVWLDIYS